MITRLKEKILDHRRTVILLGKILNKLKFLEEKPLLMLHITKRCNMSCKYCYEKRYGDGEIGTAKIIEIIGEAKRLGINNISLSGGEPLLHKNLFDLVALCYRNKQTTTIYTNGTLINKEWIRRFRTFKRRFEIVFKMDSPRSYKANTGADTMKDVENNIKACFESGIRVSTIIVVTKFNLDYIPEITKRSLDLGAFPVLERCVLTGNRFDQILNITAKEFSITLNNFHKELAKHFHIPVKRLYNNIRNAAMIKKPRFCACYGYYIYVSSNGDITNCPAVGSDYAIGNIKNETLKTILNKIKHTSKIIYKIPDGCKTCTHSIYCRGGCKTITVHKTGSFTKKDPMCLNSNMFWASRQAHEIYYRIKQDTV